MNIYYLSKELWIGFKDLKIKWKNIDYIPSPVDGPTNVHSSPSWNVKPSYEKPVT